MTTRKPPTQRPAMPQNDFDARMRVISLEIDDTEKWVKATRRQFYARVLPVICLGIVGIWIFIGVLLLK